MGKKITTRLINQTDNDMEIREFRGLITDTNDCIGMTAVKAGEYTDIDLTMYDGDDNQGGQLSKLMIFCNGSYLKSRTSTTEGEVVLIGQRFINSKTVTIDTVAEDRNVVKYKVTFEPRDASASPTDFQVFSDSVLNHDNGWSVHCNNGSVKLTRKEGMTMTLDPSKLFASNIVPDPETSLLNVVLKFWPSTFADLNCKDDLGTTIGIVNDLMHKAKLCHVDDEVDEVVVVQKVADLHKSCAAMVEWYRPLFPTMIDQFPNVDPEKLEKFEEKLKEFETTIKPMLKGTGESHD